MAKNPKSVEQAAANLAGAIPIIPDRYRQGVEGADWHTAASSDAAEANYNARMQQVLSSKARQAGVKRSSNEAWKTGALTKGVSNIATGLQNSIEKYRTNFGAVYSKVLPTITGLKPRGIDPVANVDARVKPVVTAFHNARIRGGGGR